MNWKAIVRQLIHSDLPKQAYQAVTQKWGSLGVTIALVVVILVGALVFGYELESIQTWFAALGE